MRMDTKVEIYPTAEQVLVLTWHMHMFRAVYNKTLDECIKVGDASTEDVEQLISILNGKYNWMEGVPQVILEKASYLAVFDFLYGRQKPKYKSRKWKVQSFYVGSSTVEGGTLSFPEIGITGVKVTEPVKALQAWVIKTEEGWYIQRDDSEGKEDVS